MPTASFIFFNSKVTELSLPRIKIRKAYSSVVELNLQHELSSSFSALQFFHLASATTPAVLVISFHS
jgi:hypothetical protein